MRAMNVDDQRVKDSRVSLQSQIKQNLVLVGDTVLQRRQYYYANFFFYINYTNVFANTKRL